MSDVPKPTKEESPRRPMFVAALLRLLGLCRNPISAIGLCLLLVSALLLITFLLFMVVVQQHSPYVDILGFLILPTIFLTGLILVPIGILWSRWRHRRSGSDEAVLRFDLRDPKSMTAAAIFMSVTFFFVLPIVAVSGYEGYLYTESTPFCANVCHSVMEPQGVAHANSPHARVTCAACHIGEGAGWFVKSKLSGTRQIFAVWLNTYSRPIPPAITELRPARETCEACHWPAKFHGSQFKERVYYSPDEQNTRRVVRVLLKTGGADETIGRVEGIHMHMLVSGGIDYVATDEHLQEIPWVRYVQPDGTTTVFRSDKKPTDAPPPEGISRRIDCMDCHNRGAHHFKTPQNAVNLQLEAGRIDDSLPYIKKQSVNALVQEYEDVPSAMNGIKTGIETFYQQERPEIWKTRPDDIKTAVEVVQGIYRRNFFPIMNVNWKTYPENIGHMNSPGCFRCHDGEHVDENGTAISSDCEVCHTFLNEVEDQPGVFRESRFHHHINMSLHENLRCSQCHSGGKLPLCFECHDNMRGISEWEDIPRFKSTEQEPAEKTGH